jgi:zinc protease
MKRAAIWLLVLMMPALVGAQAASWPSEAPPRPLPARPVNFPDYELRTLPNGMQVIVVMHHEQPEVTMRVLVRAGSAYDPPGKAGTAALVGSLLDQGTTTRSSQELADAIDFIGGALDSNAGGDHSSAGVLVMKDSFNVGMDMLAEVVRHPAFAPEEIERQRRQTIQSLAVSLEDPGFIAAAVISRLIYGFHPYGIPGTGTTETIDKITRNDLV